MKTMKTNKRILSLILALSMVLTSFAGLTITTASAEAPELNSWLLKPTYSTSFDEGSAANLETSMNAATLGGWSVPGRTFTDSSSGVTVKDGSLGLKWTRQLLYTRPTNDRSTKFYFKYTIKTTAEKDQNVSIAGATSSATTKILGTDDATTTTTYITVVDMDSDTIYTYKDDGTAMTPVDDYTAETVTGISFGNTSNDSTEIFYIYSFAYGTAETATGRTEALSTNPAYSTYSGNMKAKFNMLTDITQNSSYTTDAEKLAAFNSNDWVLYDSRSGQTKFLTIDNNGPVILNDGKTVRIRYGNRYLQYNKNYTGSYYYQYSVTLYGTTADSQIVALEGSKERPIVSHGTATATYTYTTIIDRDKMVAYTYDNRNSNAQVGSPIDINGEDITIRFYETSDVNFTISDFTCGIIAEKETMNLSYDYENETIAGFAAGTYEFTYKINQSDSNTTKTITVDDDNTAIKINGEDIDIPDLIGAYWLDIVKKGGEDTTDSNQWPHTAVSSRYDTPTSTDITFDTNAEKATVPKGYKYNTTSASSDMTAVTADDGLKVDVVAGGNIYVQRAASSNDRKFASAVGTITAPSAGSAPEASAAVINYPNETITIPATIQYYYNNTWNDGTGEAVALADLDWTGAETTLPIRTKATADNYASASADKTIDARPAAVDFGVAAPASAGGTGTITGVDTGMEYKGSDNVWHDIEGTTQAVAPGQYTVRVKATSSAFSGVETTKSVPDYEEVLYTISGTVTAGITSVTLTPTTGDPIVKTVTEAGTVTFDSIKGGTYTISAAYDTANYKALVINNGNTALTVNADAPTALNISVTPLATPTVTIKTPENGSVAVNNGSTPITSGDTVKEGTELTIAASPETGYETGTISVTGATLNTETNKFTVGTDNITVTVPFNAIKYEITQDIKEGGSVTITSGTTTESDKVYSTKGETVAFTLTVNPGYTVKELKWRELGGTVVDHQLDKAAGNYSFEMPARDVLIFANFEADAVETDTPAPTAIPEPKATATPVAATATPTATPLAATATPTVSPSDEPAVTGPESGQAYWKDQLSMKEEDAQYTGAFTDKDALEQADWTFEGDSRYTSISGSQVVIEWTGAAKYNKSGSKKPFAYEYQFYINAAKADSKEAQEIALIDDKGNEYKLFTEEDTNALSAAERYTTVIDPENNKAYTYAYDRNAEGDYVKTTPFSNNIVGIVFKGDSAKSESIKIVRFFFYADADDIAGEAEATATPAATDTAEATATPAATDAPAQTTAPSGVADTPEEGISYWEPEAASDTVDLTEATVAELKADTETWTFENDTDNVAAEDDGLAIKENASITYKKTDDSNPFYYTYTIKKTAPAIVNTLSLFAVGEEGAVTLAGTDIVLVDLSTLDANKGYTFTTVVDEEANKVYTYNEDGTLRGNAATIPEDANVTGITFTAPDSDNGSMVIEDVSFGLMDVAEEPSGSDYSALKPKENQKYDLLEDVLSNSAITDKKAALDSGDWTATNKGADGTLSSDNSITIRTDDPAGLQLTYQRTLQYNKSADNQMFYYKFKIRLWNKTADKQVVKLVGSSEHVIASNPETTSSYSDIDYIVAVDNASSKAYVYNYDESLIDTVELNGDAITAIKFENVDDTNFGLRIVKFIYGVYDGTEATTAPSETTAPAGDKPEDGVDYWDKGEASYKTDFTDWTPNTAGLPTATGDWTFFNNNRNDDNYLGIRNDAGTGNEPVLKLTWKGSATYNGSSDTDNFYYIYKIRMWNASNSNQVVSLAGLTDGNILVSPLADTEAHTYTTVVDVKNNKAYTYAEDGTLINTKIIPAGEKVEGVTFECLDEASALWVHEFEYGPVTNDGPAVPAETTAPGETTAPTETTTPTETATPAVTTAPGAETPEGGLSYWTEKPASYETDFSKWVRNASGLPEYEGDWTLDNGGRSNDTYLTVRDNSGSNVVAVSWQGSITYDNASKTAPFYYTYDIAMWNKDNPNQEVVLEGLTDGVVLVSPLDNTALHTYTTVVDVENSKVYTYNEDGELIDTKTIPAGESVTGITFRCLDETSAIWVNEFKYGLIDDGKEHPGETIAPVETETPSEPTPTPTPTEAPVGAESNLSDWDLEDPTKAETFDGKTIAALQEGDWKFGNVNEGANFNEKHVIINGSGELEINWYGTATYGVIDENESFYYTYTVKTRDTDGIRSVNLSGVDDSTMLVSGKDITSAARTFTTVVDINSKKAYTYDNATGDFVSEVEIPNISALKGITFSGGTVNTNVGMQVDDVSFGLVNIVAEAPSTIAVRSDDINEGETFVKEIAYTVNAEKFVDTVITFDKPVAKLEDGKTPLYLTTTLEITPASGSFPSEINIDGLTLTASEGLNEGEYPISVVAKSSFKGETLLTETYNVTLIKEKVTDEDIKNDYVPVITTEGDNGEQKVVKVNDVIDSNLTLPTNTSFANISWAVYNSGKTAESSLISPTGVVTRPIDDTEVTLVATITDPADPSRVIDTKEIKLTVKGVGDMLRDALAKAKAAIVSTDTDEEVNLSDLHEDIKLYTKYNNDEYDEYKDVTLEWTSDSNVLRVNGNVAEIYPTSTVVFNVNLTVKASALGAEIEEAIPVTIHLTKENAGDKYAVRCDDLVESNFNPMPNYAGRTISSDISVPKEGIFGSTISWTSSVPMYMSNTGKYTAPTNTTRVTMTGIVSKGTVISDQQHEYSFSVQGKSNGVNISGGSNRGSSGGGVGGTISRGSTSGTFSMPSTSTTTQTQPANAGNYNPNANTEPEGFTDLFNVPWAKEAINALADKGIISGRSEHIFDPDANITRAEFATIIVKAFGFEDEDATIDEFADVTEGDWYYSFVAAAYNNGIISGYDNGNFGSSDNITRQDMAVIIYRAANAAGVELDAVNEGKTFEDEAEIAAYAADTVDALVKAGVINGMTDTEFAPTANATRAQAAKMTYELVK